MDWTDTGLAVGVAVLAIERLTSVALAAMRKKRQNGTSGEMDPAYWKDTLLTKQSHREYVEDVVKPMAKRLEAIEDGIRDLRGRRSR